MKTTNAYIHTYSHKEPHDHIFYCHLMRDIGFDDFGIPDGTS
jgi:hypothetical protein